MHLKDIQEQIDKIMKEQNNRTMPKFDDYSPFEMHNILNFTFEANSPIILQKLADPDFVKCPMFNLVKYYLNLVKNIGEVKMTAKGFLPTKIVQDIYAQGFLEEYRFSSGYSKLFKETDSLTVSLTRILAEIAGLTKKRNGKLSLTKTGERLASNNQALFELIFRTMTQKFNWAFFDCYGNQQVGQFGFGFSLILLSKYGSEKRLDSFYADKYFNAFPQLLKSISPTYGTVEKYAGNCYTYRTFNIFLSFFGLIEIEKQGETYESKDFILKTELFDKLIKVLPHSTRS